jgi:RNA ligase
MLGEVVDVSALEAAIAAGYVRRQVHPSEPLAILNYTEKAAYENVWTEVTLACRGLIYRSDTLEIAARPFGKFFNHGQPGAPALDLAEPAVVTDKADGSLGILYPTASGHAVATRGSFTSDQAVHATQVWQARYAGTFAPQAGVTYLFEIVFPENRIVLDYGALDDLILLATIDMATGRDILAPVVTWPGPVIEVMPAASLAEALALPPRDNAEGLVVLQPRSGHRLKIKQSDYIELHRIVTNLNARTVWRHLVHGRALADLVAPLPDEFHGWCRSVADQLEAGVAARHAELQQAYHGIVATLPDSFSRKDFAVVAAVHPERWAMFLLLDGRDVRPELGRRAEPAASWTPSGRTHGEDTA